jgi:hypothetical protein
LDNISTVIPVIGSHPGTNTQILSFPIISLSFPLSKGDILGKNLEMEQLVIPEHRIIFQLQSG